MPAAEEGAEHAVQRAGQGNPRQVGKITLRVDQPQRQQHRRAGQAYEKATEQELAQALGVAYGEHAGRRCDAEDEHDARDVQRARQADHRNVQHQHGRKRRQQGHQRAGQQRNLGADQPREDHRRG